MSSGLHFWQQDSDGNFSIGWSLQSRLPRASWWLAPSSATVGGPKLRPDRPAPWLTGRPLSLKGRSARGTCWREALMEVRLKTDSVIFQRQTLALTHMASDWPRCWLVSDVCLSSLGSWRQHGPTVPAQFQRSNSVHVQGRPGPGRQPGPGARPVPLPRPGPESVYWPGAGASWGRGPGWVPQGEQHVGTRQDYRAEGTRSESRTSMRIVWAK